MSGLPAITGLDWTAQHTHTHTHTHTYTLIHTQATGAPPPIGKMHSYTAKPYVLTQTKHNAAEKKHIKVPKCHFVARSKTVSCDHMYK